MREFINRIGDTSKVDVEVFGDRIELTPHKKLNNGSYYMKFEIDAETFSEIVAHVRNVQETQ